MLKVALISVAYGNSYVTEMFVTSVIGSALVSAADVSIYIVNNSGNPDDILELDRISRFSSDVTVLHAGHNLGYFGGINYALSYLGSLLSTFDFTVISNNDMVLTPSFFSELFHSRYLASSSSVVCPQIISSDGRRENPHVLKPPSILREILYSIYYSSFFAATILSWIQAILGEKSRRISIFHDKQYSTPVSIYQGYGAMYILSKRFFDFHSTLAFPGFLMFEEFFISEQLAQLGELPLFIPSIKVFHLGKASTGKSPARQIFNYAQSSFKCYRRLVPLFGDKPSLAFQASNKLLPS